jgi:hypothetical protein
MSGHYIPATLERRVRERASNRCEYCRLAQVGQEATFHVDHIHPRGAGGETTQENLAVACVSCSLRKGARTHAPDPETREPASLFHPRREIWEEHFDLLEGMVIVGKTATGRATTELLKMNRQLAIAIRHEEMLRGRYPR